MRIRLEGGLEALEEACLQLEALCRHAHPGWEGEAGLLVALLDDWRRRAPRRLCARSTAEREPGAAPVLRRLGALEERLGERLEQALLGTAAVRAPALDGKLEVWASLARNIGPQRDEQPLAEGEAITRSREWLLGVAGALAVALLRQPLLVLLIAPLSVVWWDFCKSGVKWRLFRDCLEITELERPVRRVPLDSIETLDTEQLIGLWHVSLRGESGFVELVADVRRALSERILRGRYRESPAPALWLPGSLHEGTPPRMAHGWVVASRRGIVFVPDAMQRLAWYVVLGSPPFDAQVEVGAALRGLPERMLEDKMDALSTLKGCSVLSTLPVSAFQGLGDVMMVVLDPKRRLFVRCSHASQAQLVDLHAALASKRAPR